MLPFILERPEADMTEIAVHRYPPRYGHYPKLGPVMVQSHIVDGVQQYSMRRADADPLDPGLALSEEALAIVPYFDGRNDLRGVQHQVHVRYGQLLYCEKIHELGLALWRAGLFESPSAKQLLRAPLFAGSAYESDARRLKEKLDATFTEFDGPGLPLGRAFDARVRGIVVPHLDLQRAGGIYALGYKALAEKVDADLFVVFGTAHQSPGQLFTLTRADYDTPLGPVETDADALSILHAHLGDEIFADEAAHQDEHSIEFQALYLKHLFGDRPFSILPVLCSSLYGGRRPEEEPAFSRFLEVLSLAVRGRKVAWVASADLSHVGPVYGDALAPSPDVRRALAEQDDESLKLLERGDLDGFFNDLSRDVDTRRVCGLTPIYAAMKASGATKARRLQYAQCDDADEGSVVTCAALTLETEHP